MIHVLRKMVPPVWLDIYHRMLSYAAAMWYGHPSRRMIMVGVTGTNGKTTTAYFIAKALEADGSKTGCTSTALFKVADKEWLNDKKMTMLGRFQSQKLLRQMADAGCRYAVIETSSQGILQHRHQNIAYDVCVFTNLTPEHLEAHGGFENYKRAKIQLFKHLAALPEKIVSGKTVPRAAVLNKDDIHAMDFALSGIPMILWFGTDPSADLCAANIQETAVGVSFTVDGFNVRLQLLGRVNVWNALAALGVARVCGVELAAAAKQLEAITNMPGRFERIDEGQLWTVMVDYAPEPASLGHLYALIPILKPNRVIHVLGSCGGGRDIARRSVLGRMAAEHADVVIVTNEDPYDDDPQEIIDAVAQGARDGGKEDGVSLLRILDRGQAIQQAMDHAREGDLVLITGKGSEQAICAAKGAKIPWDDREAARSAIHAAIAKRQQNK